MIRPAILLPVCLALLLSPAARGAAPASAPAARAAAPASAPAATRPAVKPQKPAAPAIAVRRIVVAAANIKRQREAQRKSLQNLPDGGTYKMSDLVQFSMVDGRLHSKWVGKIPPGMARRVKIEGSDALWQVTRIMNGAVSYFYLTRYDFDAPEDEFWMCQFTCQETANVTGVYAQGGETCEASRLSFSQQPNMLSVNIYKLENNNRLKSILNAHAQNLYQLRSEHPEEICRFLAPLLRKITGQSLLRPAAGDVYRVFANIPADIKITQKVESLLPALGSVDPAERDQAVAALHDLGPAGTLAALRIDPDLLLPEQFNRLRALVASQSRLTMDDPAKFLKDPYFLLDCFEDDDPAVRIAAKARLEQLLGRKVAFDPAAGPEHRLTAADVIRLKIAKTARKEKNPPTP